MPGPYDDDWGLDEQFAEATLPLLDFLYDSWWRVEANGVKNVPSHGRALLVADHASMLPWDALMIGLALGREHPLPRHPRFLVLDRTLELPYVSAAIRKLGGVPASPYNAMCLLEDEELVAAFPEAMRRFGRGGFVEIALRTGAPIVPAAVVGGEPVHPRLAGVPLPSRWRIEFCEPIETAHLGPEAAGDRALVLELSERVREVVL